MITKFLPKFFLALIIGAFTSGAIATQASAADDGAKNPYDMFEGRDEELARSMAVVLKTFQSRRPYDHQLNDALVKATLTNLQFAKNNNMLDKLVAHDLETLRPILERRKKEIDETGNLNIALDVITETGCFYQLVIDGYKRTPSSVSYTSPYKRVLEASSRLGQHDMSEQEIHEVWTKPRFEGYAKVMGVDLEVSDWNEDGTITVSLVPTS